MGEERRNRSARYCAHVDDLEQQSAKRSKGAEAVVLCDAGMKTVVAVVALDTVTR